MAYRNSTPAIPAGTSPEIAAICADYFRASARGNRSDATDEILNATGKAMEAAARCLAVIPHRSVQDLAAKAQLVLYAQDENGGLSFAENDVRVSVLDAVVAMATGGAAAPRGVNSFPAPCMAGVNP